jgi:hypothetical protein
MSTTLFTWGYWGWGNHTSKLVEAVDAVEKSRSFGPPLFVDIRFRRSGHAVGFQGKVFENLVGQSRHRWMKSLGNKFIETHTGPRIQIAKPSDAVKLLDLALEAGHEKRRLLFFCSCLWPKHEGNDCHRTTVAGLVLKAATKRGVPIEVVEWPGGEPKRIDLDVTPPVFAAARKGRMTVPLGRQHKLAEVAGLPWCSIATLRSDSEEMHRVVGPAIWKKDQWALPVLFWFFDPDTNLQEYEQEAKKLRQEWGYASQLATGAPHG